MTSQTSRTKEANSLKKPSQQSQKISTASSTATAGSWQVQTAKAQFSEVFRRTRAEGPQRITRQGKEAVVMIAEEQYERLVGKSRRPKNIVDFFRQSPLMGLELDLKRDRSPARDIDL